MHRSSSYFQRLSSHARPASSHDSKIFETYITRLSTAPSLLLRLCDYALANPPVRSPAMLPTPPLDYLVAFVICFTLGALWTMCAGCYASHVRRKATACHA